MVFRSHLLPIHPTRIIRARGIRRIRGARSPISSPPSSFTHVPRRIEGRGRCRPSKRNPRDSRNKGAAIFHAPAAPDVIAPPHSFVFRPTVANDSKLAPIHLPRKGQREKSRVGRETRHVRGATWLGYVSRATIEESWGGAEGRARTERYLNSRVPFLELETVKSHRCAISFYLDRAISIVGGCCSRYYQDSLSSTAAYISRGGNE